MTTPGLIHQSIPAIMAEVGAVAKTQRNQQQGYAYRGIDDLYSTMQPLLVKHKVYVVTQVHDRQISERPTNKGGVLFCVALVVNHHFHASDGSSVTVTTIGEAMDSGDKASNKAMSAAMKYAFIQTFCIPVAGAIDSEIDSPSPSPVPPSPHPPPKQTAGDSSTPVVAATVSQQRQKAGQTYVRDITVAVNDNPSWTRYNWHDDEGHRYKTFKIPMGTVAAEAAETNSPVRIEWLPSKNTDFPDVREVVTITNCGPVVAPVQKEAAVTIQSIDAHDDIWGIVTNNGRFGTDSEAVAAQAEALIGSAIVLVYTEAARGNQIIAIREEPF